MSDSVTYEPFLTGYDVVFHEIFTLIDPGMNTSEIKPLHLAIPRNLQPRHAAPAPAPAPPGRSRRQTDNAAVAVKARCSAAADITARAETATRVEVTAHQHQHER